MQNPEPGAATAASEDAAWASIKTPLTATQLQEFCRDIERLYRINPFIEFSTWQQLDAYRYRVIGRNLSQTPGFDFDYTLTASEQGDALLVTYSQGLKTSTRFQFEDDPLGSRLTIIDDYAGASPEDRKQRLGEVDKSLIKWAGDLQLYLVMWRRWSWLAPWRWYMRRIWQPLKPTARRILYMLLWISLVEVALLILGFTVYWLEFT